MRAEERFDSFYLKTRRALVHQAFALTGDLAAAQRAVRDAYVAAWHHWHKVEGCEDPRDWVRPRAWALAQRRHSARLWQRTRDLPAPDRAVLDALHKLSGPERRALLMVELAGVPFDIAARELGVTRPTLERQLASARSGFAAALDREPSTVRTPLLGLADAAGRASLPRPSLVRREGRVRRRTHTVIAAVAVTVVAVGSGALAHQPPGGTDAAAPAIAPGTSSESTSAATPDSSPSPESLLPSADDLLTPADLRVLAPGARWTITGTHDNTAGDGINYVCQQERFADPDGLATLVRDLRARSSDVRSLTQVVEISHSNREAGDAYRKVVDWFAGCAGDALHLEDSYAVGGVAARATVLRFRSWLRPTWTYSVALAQVGQVVTTSVIHSVGTSPGLNRVAHTLGSSSRMLCERLGGACGGAPKVTVSPPPASTEAAGPLATVDLPPLPGVRQPWVGTEARGAPRAPTTTCDRASFRQMGATVARTRTFLVPTGRLPDQFGLTETYGSFRSPRAAAGFMARVRSRMASCEDRDVATEVQGPVSLRERKLDGSIWRVVTEVSESSELVFDIGFVRRGDRVAQLTFVPAGGADLAPGDFPALVTRAGERLAELR